MASGRGKDNTPAGGDDRAKMMRVLIPALAVGAIVILVAVIAGMSDGSSKKMSDGSNGSVDDPDLKELAPGVKYRDLKEGSGEACPPGAKVKVDYTGWFPDGTVFDTSKDKTKGPTEFDLSGDVIQGWKDGIPGMKPGGIRKLVIAPEKAYGSQGKGKIPADSTLIFEIELLAVISKPRPRRTPAPTDLTKLVDGTSPKEDDPNLISIGDKGLKYRDIKEGDGPVVQPGANVVVDYIGWRIADGYNFDTSWKSGNKPGGKPFSTSLSPMALQKVIPGWQKGIPGMKVGGIRKLVIPPELAYKETGAGDSIPPNATLVFEIEVLQTE